MTVHFQIHYVTHPGQQPVVCGTLAALGGGDPSAALPMRLDDPGTGRWALSLEVSGAEPFGYRYYVRDDNYKTWLDEWGPDRKVDPSDLPEGPVLFDDRWRTQSEPAYALRSSAFARSILSQDKLYKSPVIKGEAGGGKVIVRFCPEVIRIARGHRVAVTGSIPELGGWSDKSALVLGNPGHPEWSGEVAVPPDRFPIEYKYLIRDEKGRTQFWEQSGNRVLNLPAGQVPSLIRVGNELFSYPQQPWKGAGVAVPVFSLRRSDGMGIGEFTDLKLLTDWAVQTGLRMIQILPVNDTVARHTWQDSYPYAAISVYALHPVYINLSEIGRLKSDINQQIIEARGRYLNSLEKIDYEAVMHLKSRFFKLFFDEDRDRFLKDPGFLAFYESNSHWLRPYAAFSYLRDLFNTPDFNTWGEYARATPELLDRLTAPDSGHFDDIAVHYFIQYHAFRQLKSAADHARERGVVLKGDIPIGIFRNSVDAWVNPELYHMDRQAGAPPDDFSDKGQNWRFPTYNWERMALDGFSWWQQRLRQLSAFFDAFRIDHILGFFRIWEIPADQTEGLMGHFNPSLAFSAGELEQRGVRFDRERLCTPYIRGHFLEERFGDLAWLAREQYLDEYAPGCFRIKPDFDTQAKVEQKLTPEPDADPALRNRMERLARGLNSLIAEVVFLEAPGSGGNDWFPRHSVHSSRSYRELDEHQRHVIDQVYIDYFYRRNEAFWKATAMTRLPAIKKATDMLLCGEDLGMVPACVPDVMNDLGILSLEVQRMPKDPKVSFGHPAWYPYLSVATPSSHDTTTVREWWEEDPGRAAHFFRTVLGIQGTAPEACTPDIVRLIVAQHLYSPCMWAVFPIQDLIGLDGELRHPDARAERINNPANPNHYWRYRMHLSLGELMQADRLNRMLDEEIRASGRAVVY